MPAGLSDVTAIAAGYGHTVVLISSPTSVLSITRSDGSPTSAGVIHFAVRFASGVSGLTDANFTLVPTGGVSAASIAAVSGGGADWTVAVDTGSGDGALGLNLMSAEGLSPGLANLPFTGETYTVDKTPPTVTVTGVSDGAIYLLGGVPDAGCDTQDALSGVATLAALTVSGGNEDGTGDFVATCSGALDHAGNPGSASVAYEVRAVQRVFLPICAR